MSSLNKLLWIFRYSCLSLQFQFKYYFEFLLLHLSFIHGEFDHVSYMTDKFSCPICKLKSTLGHLCVMLIVQGFIPSSDYYHDSHHSPIWVSLVSTFPYPVPSHSCDLLEDPFPSSSQYGFSSVLPEDTDLELWRWYLRIHYHYWWTPLLQLSISLIVWHSVGFFPSSTLAHLFTW